MCTAHPCQRAVLANVIVMQCFLSTPFVKIGAPTTRAVFTGGQKMPVYTRETCVHPWIQPINTRPCSRLLGTQLLVFTAVFTASMDRRP